MKKTLGCLRRADQDFRLIETGDRIAVGVSGGKDSLLLLHALSLYRKFSHKDFSLLAVTVTMGMQPFDLTEISRLCAQLGIEYCVKETEIGKIIFDYRKEKNPCALCAKMRRAVLANTCVEQGYSKLALGHHREDAIETLLMSLFYEGRFHTFHPKTAMSRTGITVIRPLVYLPESHVKHMARVLELPVVKSPCPANGETRRAEMKELMRRLRLIYPDANERFLHALQQDRYDLWQKENIPDPDSSDEMNS
ncbi:MAG: tRNA 2-thiocytidine biosynthesis TtcA family protein [Clostridiales bacterium]|nr:tRNA 2-thiocytidine biosynthesis TtcA family protein [Clostridiales bacterium]